jgi:hypothetical protein
MNEVNFRNWLAKSDKSKKVQSDIVSRLKTIQREMGKCDLDLEYNHDKCETLFKAFENKGVNDTMKRYGTVKLPIGQYTLSVYRYALRIYIKFLEEK